MTRWPITYSSPNGEPVGELIRRESERPVGSVERVSTLIDEIEELLGP